MESETHPFEPFLPSRAKLLILGSFPPEKKRWSMDFYYPNLNNDMWRIMGFLFFGDGNFFLDNSRKNFCRERIYNFLVDKKIALYDTATVIRRLKNNASDRFLEVVKPADITGLLRQLPECGSVMTTGGKATEIFCRQMNIREPGVGKFSDFPFENRILRLYRMPSSSRAYPLAVEKKAAVYESVFRESGML